MLKHHSGSHTAALLKGIERLEPLPVTARMIVSHMNGADSSMQAVAEIVENDAAVTANILRQACSTRFAGYDPPASVAAAIARLGHESLLAIIVGGHLQKLGGSPMHDLSQVELWRHSAAARLAALVITEEAPKGLVPPIACTAALLHDIGKVIMSQVLDASPGDMRAYVAEHGGTFVDAERDLFGMDHAAIGALVAERWNLPPDIVDGVARHHALAMEAPSAVLDVVIVANCIAKALSHGLGSEGFNFPVDKPAVRRLRLGFPAIGRICLRTDDLLRELQESMA